MTAIPAEKLTPSDFQMTPVWSFLNEDQRGETLVQPVSKLPVSDLAGHVVGSTVCLANGQTLPAVFSNIESNNALSTKHFLNVTIFKDDKPFHLARYHDGDYERNGPKALAAFLNLPLADVFPISYDFTGLSHGSSEALRGLIEYPPGEMLSSRQLMKLIFT